MESDRLTLATITTTEAINKAIITADATTPNLKDTMLKLAYTLSLILNNYHTTSSTYIPQLYVTLKGWNPPPTLARIENQLTDFEKQMKEAIDNNKQRKEAFKNLTPSQLKVLRDKKTNKEFIILPTDNNLCPAIMNYQD